MKSSSRIPRAFLSTLILVFCTFGYHQLLGQTEPEAIDGNLYLQPNVGRNSVVVPAGTNVSVKYKENPMLYRNVKATAVNDSAATFGSDTVALHYVQELVVRKDRTHRAGKKIFLASVVSILAFYLVVGLIFLAASNPGAIMIVLGILAVLLAIPAAAAMPAGLIVGIVLMATAQKHYRLDQGWSLSTKPKPAQDVSK